ncbi:MAG: UDP-N-acetylglucosamine 2-epimerase (non-hydrolyzing) [Candidatus Omnitrophota bacterium]|nr:UDP-N-acetylglucosamine 2-epimerase (non-hydrolyzing) [Candidatus Omnitrophota bacterium]
MAGIVTIIGARPQFIKMALVSEALKRKRIKEIVIHTGQHYDAEMSGLFFKELGIRCPDYNLGVGSGSHGGQTARMLAGIEKALLAERPDMVLVYGDTNSTLAGALAAAKINIKIAHVEAGLRSYNRNMPEEINRVITDRISGALFCPTNTAVKNLRKEGISKGVYLVGDVMYDLLKLMIGKIGKSGRGYPYILCTIHRAENTDSRDNMKEIFAGLRGLGARVVLPIHPRTLECVRKYKIDVPSNVIITGPAGYKEMLGLQRWAEAVITDSGGVQKEAFILGTPCVTIRSETEWTETVKSGMNKIVGQSSERIISAVRDYRRVRPAADPEKFYGDGNAHRRIADILRKEIKG